MEKPSLIQSDFLKKFAPNFVTELKFPGSAGSLRPLPSGLHPDLVGLLKKSGYQAIYSHQQESLDALLMRANVVITTGTSSGKSLCYQIPILDVLLKNPSSTALLLFPTKALAYDQKSKFQALLQNSECLRPEQLGVYDGDTPISERKRIIDQCNILMSNPDMLHLGVLPHHTNWQRFFAGLDWIIMDEIHYYKGVFGSHVANVMRRLRRICEFYGRRPQFIMTSATIGNSKTHAEKLIESEVIVISQDGSPHGEKSFYLYNPPITDPTLGIRKSSSIESILLLDSCLRASMQTLLFTITRRSVELTWKLFAEKFPTSREEVYGYRSGYLPAARRQIESKFRSGELRGIISTNALELGIDMGNLDAVIMNGYPGAISSVMQQIGRAGRGRKKSLAVLVAAQNPMDQYLMLHPERITGGAPESAYINPDNFVILLEHLRAALFELPFSLPFEFGQADRPAISRAFSALQQFGEVHEKANRLFWLGTQYPAADTSLRNIGGTGFSLMAMDEKGTKTRIGSVDESSVHWMVHPGAVYLHEGSCFISTEIDDQNREVLLLPREVDYFTYPIQKEAISIIAVEHGIHKANYDLNFGSVLISQQVTGFREIRWETQEVLGIHPLAMPATELETSAYWFRLNDELIKALVAKNLWSAGKVEYGKAWPAIRDNIRKRDDFTCQYCGAKEGLDQHHVHHKNPIRNFRSLDEAHSPENLITLCPACHRKAEVSVYIRGGLTGLSYLLHHLASLFVLCDPKDLGISIDQDQNADHPNATIFFHDMAAGGTGLCEALYARHEDLLRAAFDLANHCACKNGCPSCVGPILNEDAGGKKEVLAILELLK